MEGLAYLLSTLLLLEHFLFLCDRLGFVFNHEGERETDKEGGGGDDPDDVSDYF